jgi:twinkle protein
VTTKFKETGLPCPCGVSSDAYCIDHEGGDFCFSCSKSPSKKFSKEKYIDLDISENDIVTAEYVPHRGLSQKTLEFFDVKTKLVNGIPLEWGFPYPNGAYKIKRVNPKSRSDKYVWKGEANTAGLFGADRFPAGSRESITITEGEHDALAIREAVGDKTAATSVQSSSTALRDCDLNRAYINSFDKIILAFDNDEAGKSALKKVVSSGLFDFNKVYYIPFDRHKDANEYLVAKERDELLKVWKACKKYTPDNIISTFNEISEALKENREDEIGTYPTDRLNDMLYGFYRGQVVLVKGLEGIGKTEIFRLMEFHLLKTTDCKLGLIHMEEDKATTIKGVATYELGVPCNLPDTGVSEEDVLRGYRDAVKGREDRVYIYTMFGGDDPDDVLDSIRFLVASGGVDIVFLDHITMLVSGVEEGDERRKLDYISTKLKKMAKELKFCLVMITHVNDDGQTRGSRMISKIADTMINLNRDLTADDENDRNTLWMTIEKNRFTGRTGKAGGLFFNTNTFKLEESHSEQL